MVARGPMARLAGMHLLRRLDRSVCCRIAALVVLLAGAAGCVRHADPRPAYPSVSRDAALRAAALEADSLVGEAQRSRDHVLLGSVVDPRYRGLGAGGVEITRAALLAACRASRFDSWEQSGREVHFYGDRVAVTGAVVATRWRGGVLETVRVDYTRVYALGEGGLRLVAGVVVPGDP